MANIVLLPDPCLLALVSIEVNDPLKLITATATTTAKEVTCPLCQQLSQRVHSRYSRTLADLPCSGQRVQWIVQVRRFRCLNPACKRKLFTERLPTCAPTYARRTLRQGDTLTEVASELGGKVGEKIARLMSMSVSHDTLLRLARRSHTPATVTPRVLGVDDFGATRKVACIAVRTLERRILPGVLPPSAEPSLNQVRLGQCSRVHYGR